MKSREDYAALRKNGIGGMQALLLKNVTKLPQFVVKTSVAH
jgi:glycosyltransferase